MSDVTWSPMRAFRRLRSSGLAWLPAVLVPVSLFAQGLAPVPTRSLGPVVATSRPLAQVREVRQLPDGRVVVNDFGAKQLLLFDSLLKTSIVALDSAGPTDRRRYGSGGALVPYLADTTLFVDFAAAALLILDGNGAVVRQTAPPSWNVITSPVRLDTKGRLIFARMGSQSMTAPSGARISLSYSGVFGFDMTRRAVDTVFWIRADTTFADGSGSRGGGSAAPRPATSLLFPIVDEHAVMSDGTIAIVRGEDYHIDWLGPDGTIMRSPRVAHEWKRLTADDKKHIADSITIARDSTNKARLAEASGQSGMRPFWDAVGRLTISPPPPGRAAATGATGVAVAPPRPLASYPVPPQALTPIPPDVVPDFLPAIAARLLTDQDNRLWIPRAPTSLPPNTRVFDIVDRSGKLIDRVSVDPSITIAGFGKGGIVYLFVRDGGVGRLQKVRFK
jgi:hypothetical protein